MYRVAMVGLGEIAWGAHIPAVRRSDRVALVAVADASADARARAERDLPGVAVYSTFEEMCDREALDAVILATPPWVTPLLAVSAAQRGLYVLAEKPVATSPTELPVYVPLSGAERDRIQVGLTYRHHPVMTELRRIVESRELGDELLVRAQVWDEARVGDERHDTLIERTLEHGSPIIHEGAHVFDWLDHILDGRSVVEDAWAVRTRPDLPAPNLTGARLSYPTATVLVEVGWLVAAMPEFVIDLIGDRGWARLDGATFRLMVSTGTDVRVVEPGHDRTAESFDIQLGRFLDLVADPHSRPEPSLDDGIRALLTSQAVADAAAARERIGSLS